MRVLFPFLFLCFMTPFGLFSQEKTEVIKLEQVNEWIGEEEGDLYVINFWATWCRPCVAELPFFDEIHKEFSDQGVRVKLASLDFVQDIEKVHRFVKKKKPVAPTYLLDEPKYNQWIDKISKEWSGAIPATLFVNKSKNIYEFHEGDYTLEELRDKVSILINE